MRSLIAYLVCAIVAGGIAYAFAPRDPQARLDTQLLTDRLQINDLLSLDKRQLAVGERGTILLSDDKGLTWQEAVVTPQRHVALTGLVAVSAEQLIAVGHDGWILRSKDAGSSWQEVHFEAEQGEPLLGVWAADSNQVLAFGSFGKFYQSDDAGRTWRALPLEVDGAHLSSMDGDTDGRRMLVGEQGLVLRTFDAGQQWQILPSFYNGSLFGVVRLSAQHWVTYGMRGHVFVSDNFGDTWEAVEVGNRLPLYGHVLLPHNTGVLIVGAGGSLVQLNKYGRLVDARLQPGLGTLTSGIALGAHQVLVAGDRGVSNNSGVSVAALSKREAHDEAK